jgi:Rnl2 family RNA ligase
MKEIKVEIPDLNQFKKRFDNFLSSKNFDYILVKNSLIFKKDEIDELFYENLYEELTENNFLNITEFKYTKDNNKEYNKSIDFHFVKTGFHKYPSLINHYAVDKVRFVEKYLNKLYYSTEKINGENSQIILNSDGSFQYGSRTMLFTEGSKEFTRLEDIVKNKKMQESILDIKKDYPESVTINVYGEYYGPGVKKMQYTETEKNYRVFDVFVYLKDSILVLGKTDLEKYFSNEQLVPFFPEVKTLKEFINDELENKSLLGGPTEGKVYKPLNCFSLEVVKITDKETGEVTEKKLFPVIKHKEDKFLEVVKKKKEVKELTKEEQDLFNKLISYITEARLENLLSHGEKYSKEKFGTLIKDFNQDIEKEFTFENPEISWKDIPQIVRKSFSKETASFLKKNFI